MYSDINAPRLVPSTPIIGGNRVERNKHHADEDIGTNHHAEQSLTCPIAGVDAAVDIGHSLKSPPPAQDTVR